MKGRLARSLDANQLWGVKMNPSKGRDASSVPCPVFSPWAGHRLPPEDYRARTSIGFHGFPRPQSWLVLIHKVWQESLSQGMLELEGTWETSGPQLPPV